MNRKIGCFIFLLALIALGVLFVWRAKTPPHVGENFARLSPVEKQERRQSAHELENSVQNLVQSSKNNARRNFAITATEEQLNTLLQDNLRIQNLPISDLRVGLAPSELALQGKVNYKGFNAVVTLRGNIVVENARLKYDLSSLELGGLPAPPALRRKAQDAVSKVLNGNLAKAPGTITRVQIEDKKLTVEGNTN